MKLDKIFTDNATVVQKNRILACLKYCEGLSTDELNNTINDRNVNNVY